MFDDIPGQPSTEEVFAPDFDSLPACLITRHRDSLNHKGIN